MRKVAGYALLVIGYAGFWWSYECLTGRVGGTPANNHFLPSFKDLFVPGRIAAPPLSLLAAAQAANDAINAGSLKTGTPGTAGGPPLLLQPQPGMTEGA